jgi:hypothetical protein
MSGAMRKVGVYLGLLEDSDSYDEEDEGYNDYETPSDRCRPFVTTEARCHSSPIVARAPCPPR